MAKQKNSNIKKVHKSTICHKNSDLFEKRTEFGTSIKHSDWSDYRKMVKFQWKIVDKEILVKYSKFCGK